MAFHPSYPTNPRVYFSYTAQVDGSLVSRISAFETRDGGASLDPVSETILLTVAQPAANHNGGHLAFGPHDGLLFAGFGDGGGGGDPWGAIGNGQNLNTVLGKLLRIDVDGVTSPSVPYRIPQGNPHAGNAPCNAGTGSQPCPEIFAFGFRNPWRWSFDRADHDLWVGDVGQGALEEVDRVVAGGNYGWRCLEGTRSYNPDCGPNAGTSLAPVAEYDHAAGQSITGGYVYRGAAIAGLQGRYVFGDFMTGRLWHIAGDQVPTRTMTAGAGTATGLAIASFAEDAAGELYIVDYGGTLHRVRAAN
jgi:glucose/arabinose dehydrogenase